MQQSTKVTLLETFWRTSLRKTNQISTGSDGGSSGPGSSSSSSSSKNNRSSINEASFSTAHFAQCMQFCYSFDLNF